ncbi:MAG: hypothetical protein V1798_07240 [Pseudomonadota bacterium]
MALAYFIPFGAMFGAALNLEFAPNAGGTGVANCFSTAADGITLIMDVKCLSDAHDFGNWDWDKGTLISECPGTGTVTAVRGDVLNWKQITFADFGLNCGEPAQVLSEMNGTWIFTDTDPPAGEAQYVCGNLSWVLSGAAGSIDACVQDYVHSDPEVSNILLTIGNGTLVLTYPNGVSDCTTVCFQAKDKAGSSKIDCQVSDKAESCTQVQGILKVSNCAVTRNAGC